MKEQERNMKTIFGLILVLVLAIGAVASVTAVVKHTTKVNADNLAKHKAEAVLLEGFRKEVSQCMLKRYDAVTIAISTDGRSGLFESLKTGERFNVTNTQVCLDSFDANAGRTDRSKNPESN
jgi:hypothetical protein